MLINNYDFELVEEPYYENYKTSYSNKTYFDFLLTYTGPEKLTGGQAEGFNQGSMGDIRIYGVAGYSNVNGKIIYNSSLTPFDNGWRYNSADTSGALLAGESAAAGLLRISDGKYQTSDGKMTVSTGEATVLSDDSIKTYSASFQRISGSSQVILVEDQYGTVRLRFRFPHTKELSAGDIYTGIELADDNSMMQSRGTHKNNNPLDSLTTFYVLHNETYYSAVPGLSGEIEQVNMRIMYWQDNEEAVFHVGIRYESDPQEEEYLIAVSLDSEAIEPDKTSSGSNSSSSIPSSDSNSSTVRIRCTFIGCSDGQVECSACDGEGGRWVYDNSTPKYDGSNSLVSRRSWENCYKCGGSGHTTCTRCGGSGWINVN